MNEKIIFMLQTHPSKGVRKNMLKAWTVNYYHVTFAFQCESTLYISLKVKELLAQNMRNI